MYTHLIFWLLWTCGCKFWPRQVPSSRASDCTATSSCYADRYKEFLWGSNTPWLKRWMFLVLWLERSSSFWGSKGFFTVQPADYSSLWTTTQTEMSGHFPTACDLIYWFWSLIPHSWGFYNSYLQKAKLFWFFAQLVMTVLWHNRKEKKFIWVWIFIALTRDEDPWLGFLIIYPSLFPFLAVPHLLHIFYSSCYS